MLRTQSRRSLLVFAAVALLYLIAGRMSKSMRDIAGPAAVSAAVAGVAAAAARRWSLYVLGALLLIAMAFIAVVMLYAASPNPDLTWGDRVLGVTKILGKLAPLVAAQLWAFSAIARRDRESIA